MDKFTFVDFVFDPAVDISEVDQFGVVDLRLAYTSHSVPENVEISADSYNGVEDARSLVGRPSDVFDAIRKANAVSAASAAATTEGAAATPSGESE